MLLFIASNDTQVRMFAPVIWALEQVRAGECVVVSLDAYYAQRASDAAGRFALRHVPAPRHKPGPPYWSASMPQRCAMFDDARAVARAILARHQPHLVVLGNDTGIVEYAFVCACRGRGVPTLLVQDGLLQPRLYTPDRVRRSLALQQMQYALRRPLSAVGLARPRLPWRRPPGLNGCTHVAVMGPWARDLLVAHGLDAQRITITGQPRFDAMLTRSTTGEDARRRLGLPAGRRVVVFASQPWVLYERWTIRQWHDLLKLVLGPFQAPGDLHLAIKLHPRDRAADYRRALAARRWGDLPVTLLEDIEVADALRAADAVIVYSSTVAIEAMILGRPVIMLDLPGNPDQFGLLARKAALAASSAQSLRQAIERATDDAPTRQALSVAASAVAHGYAGACDGLASYRVADLILRLAGRNRLTAWAPANAA